MRFTRYDGVLDVYLTQDFVHILMTSAGLLVMQNIVYFWCFDCECEYSVHNLYLYNYGGSEVDSCMCTF